MKDTLKYTYIYKINKIKNKAVKLPLTPNFKESWSRDYCPITSRKLRCSNHRCAWPQHAALAWVLTYK